MQYLKQYKKLCHIRCLSSMCDYNQNMVFEVRFQQVKPHSVFKYQLTKHKQEVKQLYNILEEDIFDFENPFPKNPISKFTQNSNSFKEELNKSLEQCKERIDVITHKTFVQFFCIELHLEDFISCLRQEEATLEKVNEAKSQIQPQPSLLSSKQKKNKQSLFDKATTLASSFQNCQLKLMPQTQVLDFTHVCYYQNQMLYVLQQPKKTAKIKNFFKSVFSQSGSKLGYLSIHRKEKNRYAKMSEVELLAEPLTMDFIEKTNMILITSSVGVYIYLAKMETKLESIEIVTMQAMKFSYVELLSCIGCCNNSLKAELYLISGAQAGQLHVYSINQEKLMKTQHKYHNPSSLCFEGQHSRLYISDSQGVHIYSVLEYLEIKKLHTVQIDTVFCSLTVNHGYLLAISQKGFMTVLELRPPQKQQLISVTTNITLPEGSIHVVGLEKNRRLLVTHFNNNVVLLDTMEGPIYSFKTKGAANIQSLFADTTNDSVITLALDGYLESIKLNEAIK